MMSRIQVALIAGALAGSIGCGAAGTSNSNTGTNTNGPIEIKLDPNNMPAGLSTSPIPTPADGKLPEGISINGAPPQSRGPIPGIPSPDQLKKGIKPGTKSTPGIPDPETLRKQLGYPSANVNPPPNGATMMKSKRKPGNSQ
jgi:hypothetical protein